MDQSFRDSIGTIDESGKRQWIYPKKPKGKLHNYRVWVSIFLLTLLFSGPFIRIGGQPLLLLNIFERKFVIFGQVFWPQDFYIFVLIMLCMVLFIVLFTVVFGRIFCGWVCPQTIFMEMVFRKIEYWIEGDFKQQKKLNDSPWNAEKIRKKGLKTLVFLAISFIVSNTFLAYIIGSEALIEIVTDSPANHIAGLISILLFTGVFYFVFAWFREQVCIVVCPYGRLQGVMLDRNSIVVAYDYIRGEIRGKFRKNESREETKKGDCIDCNQCVNVCPTGIDIRNGTQLECVNCTACIDACDHMMESVGLPKGLIRYDSEENIVSKKGKIWTPRIIGYTIVLSLILALVTFLLLSRPQIDITVLKTPGQEYQKHENDIISNMYNYKVINKTFDSIPADIRLLNTEGRIEMIGHKNLIVPAESMTEGTFFVYIDKSLLEDRKSDISIGIYNQDGELMDSYETSFLAPVKRKRK
ncbi:MAG: cytochrome c oxidase accessory protein CcoG [Bacteroidetes bacterium]|nr:MAG: cytochrome c oxidase accessory protein CcoG [Bacteroidota bacterium]MBL1144882.1 cytochrome c oxidase accessory protein CcoG [Bacteroidota bacterium]NOG57676.1 cytochrome c oxidase accessory protein CcoG [Bacteroidota bacterium]